MKMITNNFSSYIFLKSPVLYKKYQMNMYLYIWNFSVILVALTKFKFIKFAFQCSEKIGKHLYIRYMRGLISGRAYNVISLLEDRWAYVWGSYIWGAYVWGIYNLEGFNVGFYGMCLQHRVKSLFFCDQNLVSCLRRGFGFAMPVLWSKLQKINPLYNWGRGAKGSKDRHIRSNISLA